MPSSWRQRIRDAVHALAPARPSVIGVGPGQGLRFDRAFLTEKLGWGGRAGLRWPRACRCPRLPCGSGGGSGGAQRSSSR